MTTEALAGPLTEPLLVVGESLDVAQRSTDPLEFDSYTPPASEDESVRTSFVTLAGTEAIWIDCDFSRQGGTMGAVAGSRIVRAFDTATQLGLPVVETVSSGGARLQEGMISLVQMARAASAVQRHRRAGLASAAYLQSPSTGGVYASWASLADLRAAEPEATIGFGGPRVVAQVTGSFPPADSHTAESAYAHGIVDAVVPLDDRWSWLADAIGATTSGTLGLPAGRAEAPLATPVPADAYELLVRCRDPRRPGGLEWAAWITDSWTELRGSDLGMRAGLATIGGRPVVVVAFDRHIGHLPGPGAFRLAQRAVDLAGRRGLPLVTFVDTPGADPSPPSEADGIAAEIARTLLAMAGLPTSSVCVCVGEGGSGGAVALAHTDRLVMLEGSVFSVIGPEAGAAVIYRDAARAPELTRSFGMVPEALMRLGVADRVAAEDVAEVRRAIVASLAGAEPGDRDIRVDDLTTRSLTTS